MIVFDDLSVGDAITLGPTGATREQVMEFARAYDPQAFHLSDEAAARTYFGRLSASGWHTAAMTLGLITASPDWPIACRGCHEIHELRWRAPVYPEDRLWARISVIACEASAGEDTGAVTLAVALTNQEERVVAEMTLVLAVARRTGA